MTKLQTLFTLMAFMTVAAYGCDCGTGGTPRRPTPSPKSKSAPSTPRPRPSTPASK